MSTAVVLPEGVLTSLASIRDEFPILNRTNGHGQRLVYLDSAASSQKPLAVLDALDAFYRHENANIHRGVYELSESATREYERAREHVASFINASSPRECIFVRNTTEALNLVAHAWGRAIVQPGDLIVGTTMDHHSNLVPWQILAQERGANLAHIRVRPDGTLDLGHFDALMSRRPKLVTLPHVSNVLGVINDVKKLVARAHEAGAVVVIDAAQSAPHLAIDVQEIDCDFLAFSGHKMLAPMGSGVLFGKLELLERMPPFLGGGGMIDRVELGASTWAETPHKFEAGTPAVGETIGLGIAIEYLRAIGMDQVLAHEQEVTGYARRQLTEVPGAVLYGPADAAASCGVISFGLEAIPANEVAAVLSDEHIAVRAGKHCCQPLLRALGAPPVLRASFYVYNTDEDVDRLVAGLHVAHRLLSARSGSVLASDDGCLDRIVA